MKGNFVKNEKEVVNEKVGSTKLTFAIYEGERNGGYPVDIMMERCGKGTDDDVADAFVRWLKAGCIKSLFALVQDITGGDIGDCLSILADWLDQIKDLYEKTKDEVDDALKKNKDDESNVNEKEEAIDLFKRLFNAGKF